MVLEITLDPPSRLTSILPRETSVVPFLISLAFVELGHAELGPQKQLILSFRVFRVTLTSACREFGCITGS